MGEKDTVRRYDKHFRECAAPRRTTLTLERHAATAAVRLRIRNPGQRTLHALMEAWRHSPYQLPVLKRFQMA